MSSLSYATRDSATMLRRQLRHTLRYPSMMVMLAGMPIIFLLLFVYVFGATLGDGLGGPAGGRDAYVDYVVPGIVLITLASAATGTAVSVAMDMTEGIIARFRTMAIARVSVLTGHVLASLIQTMISMAAVIGVAFLAGFRPEASAAGWLAVAGLLVLISFAITWLAVAMGMAAKSVESASNLPTPLLFLPFLGSGFVPTDSLPTGLRWFAEYQPFTPLIETLRALLFDTPVDTGHAAAAIAWSAGMAMAGYVWAKMLYNRDPVG